MTTTLTVLGATGGIGRAVTHELTTRGHEVTAASRSVTTAEVPAGVRALPTDLRDPSQSRRAADGADVVVMAAQVPYAKWRTELPALVDASLDAAGDAGARLVMVDNLYAYDSPGTPISEATPETPSTDKGRLRRDLGQRLLAAHADGRARVTIGRFADYYGPHGTNSLVHVLGVERVRRGRAPQAYIDADQPHTFHHLADAARGFATLVERPEADGQVWILPAAPAITQRELLTQLARLAGLPAKIGRVTPAMLRLAGLVDANLREAWELRHQFDRPYVVDARRFERAFGAIEVTPHAEALHTTLAEAGPPATSTTVATTA